MVVLVIFLIILFILAIVLAINPEGVWDTFESWKSNRVPPKAYFIAMRVIAIIIGIIIVLEILFILNVFK